METLRKKIAKEKKMKNLKDNLYGLLCMFSFLLLAGGLFLEAFLGMIFGWCFIIAGCIMLGICYIVGLIMEKGGRHGP